MQVHTAVVITRPFPAALPHGDLVRVFEGVHCVTGTMKMGAMRFSRNMVVLVEGERVVLVNTVRLTEPGLETLESLGEVTDVIRLAGHHGSDDPFYKDRYGATVHALEGHTYFTGTNAKKGKIYFEADRFLSSDNPLPIEGSLHTIDTTPSEGILRIPAGGGTLITGDSLQNFSRVDKHFNFLGGIAMRLMGFIKPHQMGPAWAKMLKPDPEQLTRILELEFENLIPSHGAVVQGAAREKYRPSIEAYTKP